MADIRLGRSAARFSPTQRGEVLARLPREHFDLVVVGGGVTGCGVALDAASRGLAVALLERHDWASGTSSRSGKLIHGGLRYLEHGRIGVVREALAERAVLRRLCPHLIKPMRFMYPLEQRGRERLRIGAAVVLYDTLAGGGALPRHRHLTRRAALRMAPGLRAESLTGAVTFYDAQCDDARHTLTLARTAAAYGACVASRTEVIGYRQQRGRVAGVWVRDVESGAELAVSARHVVNAGGVWTGQLQRLSGAPEGLRVRASKGVHIVVPRDRIRADAAFVVRAEREPILFVRPWNDGRFWMVGTTDTEWRQDVNRPTVAREDIDYLLRNVNRVLDRPLERTDLVGAFAGLRPLVARRADRTSRLSRGHALATPNPGLTTIAGGKYTTYRAMARDAVDAAARDLPGPCPRSGTDAVPLLGAEGYPAVRNARARLAREAGLEPARVDHLLGRYGSLVDEVLALVRGRTELARPIAGAEHYLRVEAYYAASHEGALHLDDVLVRRLRASIETPDGGLRAARDVAALVGEVLAWDEATVAREQDDYRRAVAAERGPSEEDGGVPRGASDGVTIPL